MDTLTLSDGLSGPHSRAPGNTLLYYPPPTSRPRAHSTGSPLPASKRTTVKIVMGGKSYTKPRAAFEEVKKQTQPTGVSTSRYKTELCRPYQEYRVCKYGDKCQFAHGIHDLRVMPRHPKYKTELCRTYHSTGLCPYGPRCHFIHNLDEARQADSGSTPPPSPVKKSSAAPYSTSLPISPSVDSGISSPDGCPGTCRSFEFPVVGSGSSGSSGAGSGSDEGGDERFTHAPPLTRSRYATYSPLSSEYTDLESSESGILSDYGQDPFGETDATSSYGSYSPLKSAGRGGGNGFRVPSDPALDLQNLLMGLGIRDSPALPPPLSPRLSPSAANSARSRLPVFDNMMSSQSDTALLVGCASDPLRGRVASFPTFP
ncbi:mRNA decay activator protein ZFP36L1 [Geodia barretti]|uniref:mRNA decay activator protein ZFP36L1 n=1 Tax=Geodia barretti TaxID=519541 RepID=A0AA35R725_GEOBA|nr:mRNA decay activator protein ZFP36L1 [Geodia barretti]